MKSLCVENERSLRIKLLIRCAVTFLVVMAAYLLVRRYDAHYESIRLFAGICIGVCMLLFVPVFMHRRALDVSLAEVIIFTGVILRILYMLVTPWSVRPHDVEGAELTAQGGGAYILNLIINHKLPDSNRWQFYQQPLFYMLCARISSLFNGILGTSSEMDKLVDASKTVSCLAACFSVYGADMLFEVCGLNGKGKCAALAALAFLPACIITGGTIAVDSLAMLMMELILLETLTWYRKPDFIHTILLAVVCGLAVLTKISCAVMALFTAIVMVKVFIDSRNKWATAGKYAMFAAISLPLGLWYSVRNYRLFGQSLFYVAKLSTDSRLYCGELSFVYRFLTIDWKSLFSTPYADPWSQFNLPVYLIKSALFGEYTFTTVPVVLSCAMLVLGCALAVYAVIAIARAIAGKDAIPKLFAVFCVVFALLAAYFFISYPFGCSQDYRYYTITGVFASALVGFRFQDNEKNGRGLLVLPMLLIPFALCCTLFFFMV